MAHSNKSGTTDCEKEKTNAADIRIPGPAFDLPVEYSRDIIRQIFNNVREGIIVIDRDLRYRLWNRYMEEITGLKEKEILGRHALEVFPFIRENGVLDSLNRVLAGEPTQRLRYPFSLLQKGNSGWAAEMHSPLQNESGETIGVISTVSDITGEMQVQEKDEAYRALLSLCEPDVVSRLDRNFRHLFVSENIGKVTNLQPDDFIGRTHRELGFPEYDCLIWEKAIEKVFATGSLLETEFLFDGEQGRMYFDWKFIPEFNALGEVQSVLSVSRDITNTRRAEEDYRTLFREMRNGCMLCKMIYDESGNPADFRYLAMNPAFERTSGLKSETLQGKTALEMFPNRKPGWLDRYAKVVLTGEPVAFEEYRQEIDRYFAVSIFRPAPHHFAYLSEEITERKRAERTLRMVKRSIDLGNDSAFWTDPEGLVIYANDAACKSLGYTRAELLKMHITEINPGFSGRWKENWEFIREKGTVQGETVHRRKDGTEFPVEITSTFVEFDTEKYICGLARDITERRRAEEEKSHLSALLQQAQKMESVGRLAGGVAHDFNNMLGVILGHTELALDEVDQNHPLHSDLSEIQKAARRSADLTRQLLAFARKQTVQPKVLDLNETIAGMLRMMERLIGENISLDWRPGKNLWPIKIDPSQIDQILANMCVNSRDAIRDAGRIMLETDNVTLDHEYTISHPGSIPGDYVRLIVRDTGVGMDGTVLNQIFEPFFTTKKVGEGTGLGLATTYGIIKQNNGYIDVYSRLGEGTAFFIYLPRHLKKGPELLKTSSDPIKGGNQTILLVEDEPAILNLTKRLLEQLGYSVLAAHTPSEAMQLARKCGEVIHVLMTDVIMPEMNGPDLANNLRTLFPSIKRLFTSGYTANVIAHHGVLDSGIHYLQKPFGSRELASKLQEVLSAK